MIEEKVKDILKKYRNLEQKKDWKNQKLLGNDLKFSARDLINVYVELEKEFDIHFKEKDIVAGKFDTFDDIIKLINKEIAYKTRGKEHSINQFIHCFKTAKEYYVYDVNTDKIIQVSFETYNFLENNIWDEKSGKRNRKANK